MTTHPRIGPLSTTASVLLATVATTVLSSGCSSSPEQTSPPLRLEGTYAARYVNDATPFRRIWFARDGRYRAYLAKCDLDCNESGTFLLEDRTLVTRSAAGTEHRFPANIVVPDDAKTTAARGIRWRDEATQPTSDTAAAACSPGDGADLPPEPADEAESEEGSDPSPGAGQLTTGGSSSLVNRCGGTLIASGVAPGVDIGDSPFDRIGNRDMTLARGKTCGFGSSCQSYTCYECGGGGQGCVVDKSGVCDYLCPSHKETRCTGWMDSNFLRRCGSGDGCTR